MKVSAVLAAAVSMGDARKNHHHSDHPNEQSVAASDHHDHHHVHHRRRRASNKNYTFKIHKNAISKNETDLTLRSFLNFGDEDKQMMAKLTETGGRRYMHLTKMVSWLWGNKDNQETPSMTKWWGYGCWCIAHGENPTLATRGLPEDSVDAVCKDHALCYDCARMDYGIQCDATQMGYDVMGNKDLLTGTKYLSCDVDSNTVCQKSLCECDKMLAEGLFRTDDEYEKDLHIATSGFDGHSDCEIPPPVHDWGEMDQCCGEYPQRAPYRSDNGNRQCCGDKTYHTFYLECCKGEVKTKGYCTVNA